MNEYRIVWEIDLDAKNPVAAAEEALAVMRDTGSDAVVFKVFPTEALDERGNIVDESSGSLVDLGAANYCDVCDSPAYHSHSPEGQNCSKCGAWICDNCTTWDNETPLCPDCAGKGDTGIFAGVISRDLTSAEQKALDSIFPEREEGLRIAITQYAGSDGDATVRCLEVGDITYPWRGNLEDGVYVTSGAKCAIAEDFGAERAEEICDLIVEAVTKALEEEDDD